MVYTVSNTSSKGTTFDTATSFSIGLRPNKVSARLTSGQVERVMAWNFI